MSYYDSLVTENKDKNVKIGRSIYMSVLSGRRGFRYDQLGIQDANTWVEIFSEMGKIAREVVIIEISPDVRESFQVDWNKPLVTAMKGVPVSIHEWEDTCKWLKVGAGIYMYNNDGTCVSGGGMRVFNSVDPIEQTGIEGRK